MAICEPTSFTDPILIYGSGAVINLYNVIFKDTLNFKYIAVDDNLYHFDHSKGEINLSQHEWCESSNDLKNSLDASIVLFSINIDIFKDLIDWFPKSAALLQKYAIA